MGDSDVGTIAQWFGGALMGAPQVEVERLERLEGASGQLAAALRSGGVMALRLRQIGRRAPEVGALVELAHQELAELVDACDDAHELIKEQLAADQVIRSSGGAQ